MFPIMLYIFPVIFVGTLVFTLLMMFNPKFRDKIEGPHIEMRARRMKKGFTEEGSVFCKHCGFFIDNDSKYCKSCGKEQ